MMYINFILLLVYPRGIYVENNGYLETRYLFLGMDNQAAILLLTFIIIIYAIEKSEPCLPKISLGFYRILSCGQLILTGILLVCIY